MDFHGCKGFNPRARDGREMNIPNLQSYPFVSIHAPVMDAKLAPRQYSYPVLRFNPRARDGRE